MSRLDIYKKLNEVFQDVFDDPTLTVSDTTTAADVDGWDSLEHMNLVVAVEEAFKVRFTMGEIGGLKCVGDLANLLERR